MRKTGSRNPVKTNLSPFLWLLLNFFCLVLLDWSGTFLCILGETGCCSFKVFPYGKGERVIQEKWISCQNRPWRYDSVQWGLVSVLDNTILYWTAVSQIPGHLASLFLKYQEFGVVLMTINCTHFKTIPLWGQKGLPSKKDHLESETSWKCLIV